MGQLHFNHGLLTALSLEDECSWKFPISYEEYPLYYIWLAVFQATHPTPLDEEPYGWETRLPCAPELEAEVRATITVEQAERFEDYVRMPMLFSYGTI